MGARREVLSAVAERYRSAGRVEKLGVFGYIVVLVLSFLNSISCAGPLVSVSVNKEAVRKTTSGRLLPILRGILIAIPILIITLGFFSRFPNSI